MKKEDNTRRIFLDYAGTTPIDPDVFSAMTASASLYANPSALYSEARDAKEAIRGARKEIARICNVTAEEIVFTSGGTEGNNIALLGVFEMVRIQHPEITQPHIIVTNIEHPAILEVCNEIERRGGEITVVPVGPDGRVSSSAISDAITPNTVLVSVMYANNEVGTIQPIADIGRKIKQWREKHNSVFPYFHSDACQAVLYCSMNMHSLGLDLATVDGIKMYGPRGIGVLYKKEGVQLHPVIFGGGQEGGLRSGTEHVGAIVGLAVAFQKAEQLKESESVRLTALRDYAIDCILQRFPDATVNGSQEHRLPNNINICFPGIDAEFQVVSLDVHGISASYSSACRTLKEDSTSYVVEALGKGGCAGSSLRFTLGRETTKEEVNRLVEALMDLIK